MSIQENKDIVRRFFDERWNHGNLEVYDELMASGQDIEGSKEWARWMHRALGNIHLQIFDIVAEGEQVAIHWRVDAIHQGEFLGIPATGKPITYQGIALLRLVNGKIIDDTGYWDNLQILKQLNVSLPV